METHIYWCLILLTMASWASTSSLCNQKAKGQPGDPSLPTVINKRNPYQASVTMTVVDKNYTIEVDINMDYLGNRARLVTHRNGLTTSAIYDFTNDQVFHITGGKCTTSKASADPLFFLLGDKTDETHVFGTSSAFRLTDKDNPIYNGTSVVRGMPVDQWTTCLSLPQANFTASYYFNKPDWTMPAGLLSVPVRIEAEGVCSAPQGGQPRPFHHVYDFINFQPSGGDPRIFNTPEGVVCPKRIATRELPTFGSAFSFRAELVFPSKQTIVHYAVWLDESAKMVREDRRDEDAQAPAYIDNGYTVIQDFSVGVRYIKDKVTGACTVWPLDIDASDVDWNKARNQDNKTVVASMKSPWAFFSFNKNYQYKGQKMARGIPCDVFGAVLPDDLSTDGRTNATYEYYFLTDSWNDVPLDGRAAANQNKDFPIKLVITSATGSSREYNFYDFNEQSPSFSTYDVSSCFDETKRIDFTLLFPGAYNKKTESTWKYNLLFGLAEAGMVSPIRVSDIRIRADFNIIYASASLLGSATEQQFEVSPFGTLERKAMAVYKGIKESGKCADLCVRNPRFKCRSFDMCPDDGWACRLSNSSTFTSAVLINATKCTHFTRTVGNADVKEPLLRDAYSRILASVTQRNLQITIKDSVGDETTFTARSILLTSGTPYDSKPMPSLPSQFSYRMELVDPDISRTVESYLWYDSKTKLVRLDTRDVHNGPPLEISTIHDFNDGVSFQISRVTEKCTVRSIGANAIGLFDLNGNASKIHSDGSSTFVMKSPLQMFYLDRNYTYVGQTTVRGILCDVFESQRSDYMTGTDQLNQKSLFKYYFQSDFWAYYSVESLDITRSQPVRLDITDATTSTSYTINFFDFDDEHHALKYFDISKCYPPEQRRSFLFNFKGQGYHPYLDGASDTFLEHANVVLSQSTSVSPIHFQGLSVTHNDEDVFLLVTALGALPPTVLFLQTASVQYNASVSHLHAKTVTDCANACLTENRFVCNSFDFCSNKSECTTGTSYGEGEGQALSDHAACAHYTKPEKWAYREKDIQDIQNTLVDYVYANLFKIRILDKTYIATDIRNDVLRPTDPESSSGSFLRKFVMTPYYHFNSNLIIVTHTKVSVSDCAVLCIQENTFTCEGFDYRFTVGLCRLVKVHPDQSEGLTHPDVYSRVYSRVYTDEYTKLQGYISQVSANKTVTDVSTANLCARACTTEASFQCESFEMCGGEKTTCLLRKFQQVTQPDPGSPKASNCSFYSRNHLYDYTRRDGKVISGHDDMTLKKSDAITCAQTCSMGALISCSSFEVCQGQDGSFTCTLSAADPTTSKDLQIVANPQCSLFTLVNPVPLVNPTGHKTTSDISHRPQPTSPSQCTTGSCTQGASTSSADTGARVGIAFGCLCLGVVCGVVCAYLFIRWKKGSGHLVESTMLSTWENKGGF